MMAMTNSKAPDPMKKSVTPPAVKKTANTAPLNTKQVPHLPGTKQAPKKMTGKQVKTLPGK